MTTQQQITPKIITPTGYIKLGYSGEDKFIEKSPQDNAGDMEKVSSRHELKIMREKMMTELCSLLKTNGKSTREEIYQIMKEEGFLPIVGGNKEMGFARFKLYYSDARKSLGISSLTDSKTEYISANYKTKSVSRIAAHVGTKDIYVRQVIYRYRKKGVIK